MLTRSCTFGFVLALLTSTAGFAADAVFPPGSRIGLVPPPEMVPSEGIAGFRDPGTGSALATIEMPPDAYPSIAASFGDEALRAQGFTLKSRETVKIGETDAMLVSGEQNQNGVAIGKSLLLAASSGMTVLAIAQSAPGAPPALVERLKNALKTVALRPPLTIDQQLAALPFTLGDLAGFRPLRVMAGNALMLTDGPSDTITDASQPVLIVAHSVAPPPPPDQRDALARQLLTSNTFLTETMLERAGGFRQAGADWHEIVAKAKDARTGVPVIAMQTIRFMPGGYLRMVGIVKADQRDGVMPRLRRVVDSIAPR